MSASSNRLYFLYHELRAAPSNYSYVIARDTFEHHADLYLKARSQGDTTLWPEITFDDGHISNYEVALPSLAARNLTATFFLTVGWMGNRAGYMEWNQVQALRAAGQHIGAHGWSHALLTHCDNSELERELKTSRLTLEDKLATAITIMSLPGGRFNQRVLNACREAGYEQVYTSIPSSTPGEESTPFLVGRLNLRSNTSLETIAQLLDTNCGALTKLERQDKWKSALKKTLGDRTYARLWAALNRQEHDVDQAETPLP